MGTRQLHGNHLPQAGEILELPISGMCSPAGLGQGQTRRLGAGGREANVYREAPGKLGHEVHCTPQCKEMKRVFISFR